jgi:hypothetical protein
MDKTVSIYRFDYELKNSTWTVYIAAFKQEDAMRLLRERVGNEIRITSTSVISRIDVFEKKVIDKILSYSEPPKRGRGRPKGSTKKKVEKK